MRSSNGEIPRAGSPRERAPAPLWLSAHRAILLALPALVLVASCGSKSNTATGTARIVVRPLVAETYIARLTVTVSRGLEGTDFSPVVAELARSGNQWNGRVAGIPVGNQREFDVIALDDQGNGLFAAFARGDIVANAATVISLTLDNRPPAGSQNAFPIIDSVSWSPDPPEPSQVVQFRVTVHDPDPGDTLSYAWSADCGVFDDVTSRTPRWTAPDRQGPCHVTIAVSDSHGAKVGLDFTVPVTIGTGINVSVNSWPVITSLAGALVVKNTTLEGDLGVQASDADGNALSYAWESSCSGIAFKLTPPASVTTPHITLPLSSTPCTVTVSVSDGVAPAATTGTLVLSPEVVRLNCQNVVCPDNQACDPMDGLCKPKTACTPSCAGKACGSDGCNGSCGTCQPGVQACSANNQCVNVCGPACAGKSCGPDGCGGSCGGCDTASLTCSSQGQCVPKCTPACNGKSCGPDGCNGSCGSCDPSTQVCSAGGQCVAGVCTPSCGGRSCGPDGCGGSCGACNPATQSCSAAGQCIDNCVPSCGGKSCGPDGCGGSCGACNPATQTCSAAGQCVDNCAPACGGKSCGPDGCGGVCGTCDPIAQVCSAAGQCTVRNTGTAVVPVVARDVQAVPPSALAMDASGSTYLAATLTSSAAVDFQTTSGGPPVSLSSSGGSDIFLARYDAAGSIVWGRAIGDDDPTQPTDQTATGAAANAQGRVGIIGKIAGNVTFGAKKVSSASGAPYLAALSAADGTGAWAAAFDLGSNGAFNAVAASASGASGRFAVCGQAVRAATSLVPGAVYGGLLDVVIAVFDNTGNKVWSAQLGGAGNELCSAIAVDDNGDVFAAGQFDGATLAFPGATPVTVTGPGTTIRKFLWVAKFAGSGNGSGGANVLAAQAYSGPAGQLLPKSAAADSAGDLFVGGKFSGSPTIGAVITAGGGEDAFVAKFDKTTLAPAANAVRLGGSGNDLVSSVAITAAGDVVATGSINPSSPTFKAANGGFDATGIANLTVSGTTTPDLFVVKLGGATLATHDAQAYGDADTQFGDSIAACRTPSSSAVVFSATLSGTVTFGSAGTVTSNNVSPAGSPAPDVALVFSQLR